MAKSTWRRVLGRTLIGAQLVGTVLALEAGGVLAATDWQQHQLQVAARSAEAADAAFTAQVARSLGDGTPKELLQPLAQREAAIRAGHLPATRLLVDRTVVGAAQARAAALAAMPGQVVAVETQVEVQLHQQLVDAIKALRADEPKAQGAGVDPADYETFAAATESQNQALATPDATRALIATVQAKDQALQQAVATAIAAQQALADAQSAARTALANAQAALARAEAIPALNVQGAAGALPGLAQRVQSAATVADYQSATAALDAQTASLNALVDLRQSAYDLLAKTQAHMQRAQQGGIDVSADQPQLDAAAKALDAASDTSSLDAAKQQVQNVKNDVDVKYNLAVYGPGKVIVVSIALEELEALQDGVVVQDTLVTTGRPSLPTPVGTFSVMAKYSPYHMVSPWPYGNHYYYPPVWLKYAMLWHDGGYFIHDASWRYHYGPGSDTEYGGTHGCINVPGASIGWLYNWAEVGTKVVTLSDVF